MKRNIIAAQSKTANNLNSHIHPAGFESVVTLFESAEKITTASVNTATTASDPLRIVIVDADDLSTLSIEQYIQVFGAQRWMNNILQDQNRLVVRVKVSSVRSYLSTYGNKVESVVLVSSFVEDSVMFGKIVNALNPNTTGSQSALRYYGNIILFASDVKTQTINLGNYDIAYRFLSDNVSYQALKNRYVPVPETGCVDMEEDDNVVAIENDPGNHVLLLPSVEHMPVIANRSMRYNPLHQIVFGIDTSKPANLQAIQQAIVTMMIQHNGISVQLHNLKTVADSTLATVAANVQAGLAGKRVAGSFYYQDRQDITSLRNIFSSLRTSEMLVTNAIWLQSLAIGNGIPVVATSLSTDGSLTPIENNILGWNTSMSSQIAWSVYVDPSNIYHTILFDGPNKGGKGTNAADPIARSVVYHSNGYTGAALANPLYVQLSDVLVRFYKIYADSLLLRNIMRNMLDMASVKVERKLMDLIGLQRDIAPYFVYPFDEQDFKVQIATRIALLLGVSQATIDAGDAVAIATQLLQDTSKASNRDAIAFFIAQFVSHLPCGNNYFQSAYDYVHDSLFTVGFTMDLLVNAYKAQQAINVEANPFIADRIMGNGFATNDSKIFTLDGKHYNPDMHRSGWPFVIEYGLKPFVDRFGDAHHPVLVDTYVDRSFLASSCTDQLVQDGVLPYARPWIGFIHHTFENKFAIRMNAGNLFQSSLFVQSLAQCRGLIVFSNDMKVKVQNALATLGHSSVPVASLFHPTQSVGEENSFSMDKFLANMDKKVVQIGGWYRDTNAIYRLGVNAGSANFNPLGLRKVAIRGYHMDAYYLCGLLDDYVPGVKNLAIQQLGAADGAEPGITQAITCSNTDGGAIGMSRDGCMSRDMSRDMSNEGCGCVSRDMSSDGNSCYVDPASSGLLQSQLPRNKWAYSMMRSLVDQYRSVQVVDMIDNATYDELLTQNIVFIWLYDAAAVNTIIECMVRNTPIIVNRLPATVEYLGAGYPLFCDDLGHAAALATDVNKIKAAYEYLVAKDKSFLNVDSFVNSFNNCSVVANAKVVIPM